MVQCQVEIPWFLASLDDTEPAYPERSGVQLAAEAGALCGLGVNVGLELVARAGKRATVPCTSVPDKALGGALG